MSEPITNREEAVREFGAFPMPMGAELRTLDKVEDELTGVSLALYEEELENARLRLALASAQRGRRGLRADCLSAEESRGRWRAACIEAERERDQLRAQVAALLTERHSTNESLDDAAKALRVQRDRLAELEAFEVEAVAVSESLSQTLHDEMLVASALYAALTMPTTPEQRQAALDRYLFVARRIGQKHAPLVSVVEGDSSVRLDITPGGEEWCTGCTSDHSPDECGYRPESGGAS